MAKAGRPAVLAGGSAARRTAAYRQAVPGLAIAFVTAAVACAISRAVPAANPLVLTVVLGVLVRNAGWLTPAMRPGLRLASRPLLRVGVMLLGLQLALGRVVGVGAVVVVTVVCAVAVTFAATRWIGSLLGLTPARALLVSTGVAVCGASAIVAMNEVADGDEEDVAAALATVTVLGSLAIFAFPVLGAGLGLPDGRYGVWAGASVHEVGQVVAIGSAAGSVALQVAVVVKLARVVLLAPLVAAVGWQRRRRGAGRAAPVVPWFVTGFLAMAALRTTGVVPGCVVSAAGALTNVLLAAALFALGAGVDIRAVARGGSCTLVAGALGTALLMALVLAGLAFVD